MAPNPRDVEDLARLAYAGATGQELAPMSAYGTDREVRDSWTYKYSIYMC